MEPTQLFQKQSTSFINSFMAQVYGWMSLGLLISFGISFAIYFFVDANPSLSLGLYGLMFVSFIFQLILIFIISSQAAKLNTFIAGGLFILFAALNGLTLGTFTIYYELGSIAIAFLAAFLTFAVMSVAGALVKRDLTSLGGLAMFGLIGLIIGTFVNFILYFFLPQLATGISWILTYLGLGIFMILVAYDTQKLKNIAIEAENKGIPAGGIAVQGALALYLDFINIFLRLLAIFGKRR